MKGSGKLQSGSDPLEWRWGGWGENGGERGSREAKDQTGDGKD